MYTEKVMDHFQHPRNAGELEDPSGVGAAESFDPNRLDI